tara:strand:+ start:1410 stop:3155 length:1746 start_codon:yes stop_codon:yes gene_type:complete
MGSIFDGTPQSASSYSASTSETPKWMQDAIYNQVNWAQNIANKPYDEYALPTVAELSPLQQQAYTGIQDAQGAYKENFNKAQLGMEGMSTAGTSGALSTAQANYLRDDLVGQNLDAGQKLFDQAGNLDILGSAQPLLNQAQTNANNIVGSASPYLTQAAGMSASDAANPYLQSGTSASGFNAANPLLQQAAGASGMNAANPYMNQSQSTTAQALADKALNAANPYLQQASQSSVSNIDQYMNPYQTNVMDAIAQQGTRNLTENLLPGVSDSFIRAGQFGSRGMGEFGSRALRDTQESVLRQQAPMMQQGYAQAMQASAADKARQASLAGTVGSISGADLGRTLQGASQYANLGQQAGQLTGADAARQAQVASTMGQLTGQDASRQMQAASTAGQMMGQDANRQAQLGQTMGQLTGQQASQLASLGATTGQLTGQQMSQLGSLAQARTGAGQSQQQFGLNAASQVQQAEAQDLQRQMSALQSMGDMAIADQQANYRDLTALEAAGQSEQQQMQTELSAAEREFLNKQLYPQQQLDFLGTQVRGMAPITDKRTTVSGQTTGATYNNSPLSQLAAGFATYKGLS